MYLFIDTETTGLPKKRNSSVFDVDNWPRIVEIAWLQFDSFEKEVKRSSQIIRPEGFTISRSATAIHGISTKTAKEEGVPLLDVLNRLSSIIEQSTIIVFHNKAFDENVLGAEFIRTKYLHRCFLTFLSSFPHVSGGNPVSTALGWIPARNMRE